MVKKILALGLGIAVLLGMSATVSQSAQTTSPTFDEITRRLRQCKYAPDVIVSTVAEPDYDLPTRESIVVATIKNQGGSPIASPVTVRLRENGNSYLKVLGGGMLAGQTRLVTFRVKGWILDVDASFVIDVDPANHLTECNEINNSRSYDVAG